MALAIDASTPSLASTATAASVTSASFTPPAGAVLVACIGANNAGTVDTAMSSVTNTGTTTTWTRRAQKTTGAASTGGVGTNGGAELWTATAPGGAITVTATNGQTGSGDDKALQVFVLTGADTASLANVAAASSASGLPSASVASVQSGSFVFAASSDWAQRGLGTAGTGQTITSEYNLAGQITFHFWRTTSTTAAGSQTMNLTLPTAQQYNIAALEVRAASGASTKRPMSTVNRAALIRASNF